jgi:hypothetical protein
VHLSLKCRSNTEAFENPHFAVGTTIDHFPLTKMETGMNGGETSDEIRAEI